MRIRRRNSDEAAIGYDGYSGQRLRSFEIDGFELSVPCRRPYDVTIVQSLALDIGSILVAARYECASVDLVD